jgi:hypothetical protein
MNEKQVKIRMDVENCDLQLSEAYGMRKTFEYIYKGMNNTPTFIKKDMPDGNPLSYSDVKPSIIDGWISDAINQKFVYSTTGTMTMDKGEINITYPESVSLMDFDEDGTSDFFTLNNENILIKFSEDTPSTLYINTPSSYIKHHIFDSSLKRYISSVDTETGVREYGVFTHKMSNTVTFDGGGVISVDFETDFYGERNDRNRINIEVKILESEAVE